MPPGTADLVDVVATAGRLADGDADSWLDEWMATSGSAWAQARAAERLEDRAGALARYRRAATYYALALRQVLHSSEPERELDIWRRQRACWEHVVDLSPVAGERLAIPYADATLPGFFFRAPDADPANRGQSSWSTTGSPHRHRTRGPTPAAQPPPTATTG